MNKSPFFAIDNFISPLACEDIINQLDNQPIANYTARVVKENGLAEIRLIPLIKTLMPQLEKYYGFSYDGLTYFNFEWYPSGYKAQSPICENSVYRAGQWSRTNNRDFTGVIFLNDYQDKPPFDDDYEVYGGNLEFQNFNLKFHPQRGQLVVFPSGPNFINTTSDVKIGSLTQIKFHITAEKRFEYSSSDFPGNYTDWFKT